MKTTRFWSTSARWRLWSNSKHLTCQSFKQWPWKVQRNGPSRIATGKCITRSWETCGEELVPKTPWNYCILWTILLTRELSWSWTHLLRTTGSKKRLTGGENFPTTNKWCPSSGSKAVAVTAHPRSATGISTFTSWLPVSIWPRSSSTTEHIS